MSSIDEIKLLLIVAVMLIGLVALLAALRRNGVTRKLAAGAGGLDPGSLPANGAPLPRMASANGADWAREPNGAWQRVDDGAIPPIEYPPGE
ncbi:MAG: hypothetical protein HY870_22415 [Chloroflexi bacterium]|nr:hypothetical protein [Chloroflexota bacterium]